MQRLIINSVISTFALLLLASCSSVPTATTATNSRYSMQQDRAPTTGSLDLTSIPEVVPQAVTRTMAGNRSPYTVLGKTYYVLATEQGYSERGVASWYGEKFHGHKTSNGEVFDMYQASAAHKSLPIPSFLRVTNLDNNRSIVVRVNDRGPFHGERLVDLSYAAALKLGFVEQGTARVQLDAVVATGAWQDSTVAQPIRPNEEPLVQRSSSNSPAATIGARGGKYIQVGAFAKLSTAREVSNQLRELTDRPVFIRSISSQDNGVLHRVRVGPVSDPGEIQRITQSVVAAKLGSPYTVTE